MFRYNNIIKKDRDTSFFFSNVVSPQNEFIAYEILWAKKGMTEKKMADMFQDRILPSQFLANEDDFVDPELMDTITNYLQKMTDSFSISIHGDFQYPQKLRCARYPLKLFYYKGDIELANAPCISIVGSRKCSPDGLLRAKKMAKLLVKKDYTIVSGLAEGVDTAALEAAIEAGGRVIGVIGTPLNQYYPQKNKSLQDLIAKKHLLISQVPFYRYNNEPFKERRFYFPRRNSTMSALSEGTVIIEAGETSGTLSQARAAIYQKRKLFILDSCFKNKNISWPDKYKKKGAIQVFGIEDVLSHLE